MPGHDGNGDVRVHLKSIPTLQDRIEGFIYRRSFYDIFWYGRPEEGGRRLAEPSPEFLEKLTVAAIFVAKRFWRIRRAKIKIKGELLYSRLNTKYHEEFEVKSMCVIAKKNSPLVVEIIVVMAQVGGAIQLIQIASTAIGYTAQQVFGREFRAEQENAGAQEEGARVPSPNVLARVLVIIMIGILVFLIFKGTISGWWGLLANSR